MLLDGLCGVPIGYFIILFAFVLASGEKDEYTLEGGKWLKIRVFTGNATPRANGTPRACRSRRDLHWCSVFTYGCKCRLRRAVLAISLGAVSSVLLFYPDRDRPAASLRHFNTRVPKESLFGWPSGPWSPTRDIRFFR